MEKKICKKCLIEKDICEFYKNSQSKDGGWTDNLSKGKKQFELTCFYKTTLNNNF
jgi:hypothetical protein